MTSYLLSFLQQKYSKRGVEDFAREMPRHWLVWEPGQWRPPRAERQTLLAPEEALGEKGNGEALVMALPEPKQGQDHLEVGREDKNEIVIHDATVSRVHFLLSHGGSGGWTLRDGGSSNGTWVEGARIEGDRSATLSSGSSIRAGSVQLTFYEAHDLFKRVKPA